MTHQTPAGPRKAIEAALWDWWITTDPLADFTPADVATQIDEHLHTCGYTITPNTRKHPMPTRRTIATAALIALICAIGAVFAALRHEWWWAAIGALGAALLAREVIRDLADRRHGRNAR